MSRIHEALKKAAQERSANLAAEISPMSRDLAVETESRQGAAGEIVFPQVPQPSPKGGTVFLRLEDLVKRCAKPKWQMDARSVFHGEVYDNTGAERFRTLRSRLYQIAATRTLKRILVTSSVPEEGKTFVTANLAQSIVRQHDRRVLLIDADLRASRLHQLLGAPASPGLAEYLRGDCDEFQVIQCGPDANLFFIPGGVQVSNPSELLLGDRMKRLMDLVTPVFDWIILDSPPALPVHDASMLADFCDGVLFVVRAGDTDFELAVKASSEFREKNLLGVVLNRVEKRDSYGTYYYGYGHPASTEREPA